MTGRHEGEFRILPLETASGVPGANCLIVPRMLDRPVREQ